MAKPHLGTKRICSSCGTRFYDLNRDPIACPQCATVFVPPIPDEPSRKPGRRAAPTLPPKPPVSPELVEVENDTDLSAPEQIKADETLDDAGIIEPEEQDVDDDITDIVGDSTDRHGDK